MKRGYPISKVALLAVISFIAWGSLPAAQAVTSITVTATIKFGTTSETGAHPSIQYSRAGTLTISYTPNSSVFSKAPTCGLFASTDTTFATNLGTSFNPMQAPGSYLAQCSGATAASGYSITSYSVQNLTITAIPITETAKDHVIYYSGFFSNDVITAQTLLGSDSIVASTYTYAGTGSTSYTSSTVPPTAVGTYSITPSGFSVVAPNSADIADYSITPVSGTLTINALPITMTANDHIIPFGGSFTNGVSTVTTLYGSDVISATVYTYTGKGSTTYGPSTTAPSNVGTYNIIPSNFVVSPNSANSSHYAITPAAGTLTITQLPQHIIFAALSNVTGPSNINLQATSFQDTANSIPTNQTVAFQSLTPLVCTVYNKSALFVASGQCTISAIQAGNADYQAASSVTQSFAWTQGLQTSQLNSTAGSTRVTLTVPTPSSGGHTNVLFSSLSPVGNSH